MDNSTYTCIRCTSNTPLVEREKKYGLVIGSNRVIGTKECASSKDTRKPALVRWLMELRALTRAKREKEASSYSTFFFILCFLAAAVSKVIWAESWELPFLFLLLFTFKECLGRRRKQSLIKLMLFPLFAQNCPFFSCLARNWRRELAFPGKRNRLKLTSRWPDTNWLPTIFFPFGRCYGGEEPSTDKN